MTTNAQPTALVVVPATPPPTARWVIDEDAAARLAAARGERVARRLRAAGIQARVLVGDPDPAQAVRDASHRARTEFLRMPRRAAA